MRQGIVFGPDYSSDRRTIREAALTSLSRAALATALNVFNRSIDPGSYVAKAWPEDRTARLITRGAVDPIDTADAAALVTVAMAFASALVGQSAGAASFERALKLRFEGGAGAISIPNVAIAGGGFVHEGDAMPVIKGTTTAAQLRPYKLGAITVLSVEMLRSVNAEQLIRSALLESTAANLDAVLFDDQPEVEGLRPAGLCFGRAPLVASAGGGFDALVADVRALVAAVAPFAGNGQVALVTAVSQAVDIALRTPRDLPFVVLPSSGIAAGKVVAVALPALAAALGVPAVEASRSAVLHMEDTNPQPIAPGGALASPVYSIFQLIRPRSDCDGRLDGSPARAARWHGSAAQRGDDYGR